MKLHGKLTFSLVQTSLDLLGFYHFGLSPLVLGSEMFNIINSLDLYD